LKKTSTCVFHKGTKNKSEDKNKCLKLNHAIYGLVQAARQWWKVLIATLKALNFEQCGVDTCLLRKTDGNGTVLMCVYVDDALCVGDKPAIEKAIQDVQKHFKITRTGPITEYVGCTVMRAGREKSLTMSQMGLIDRIGKEFKAELSKTRSYATPAAPGEVIIRPKDASELIGSAEQSKFRSGVGMLLYLVKFSRPDIANGVRELSKVMDGATAAHVKSLHRILKYVVDTRNRVLRMKLSDMTGNQEQGWL
jgi:hypothetical protein